MDFFLCFFFEFSFLKGIYMYSCSTNFKNKQMNESITEGCARGTSSSSQNKDDNNFFLCAIVVHHQWYNYLEGQFPLIHNAWLCVDDDVVIELSHFSLNSSTSGKWDIMSYQITWKFSALISRYRLHVDLSG